MFFIKKSTKECKDAFLTIKCIINQARCLIQIVMVDRLGIVMLCQQMAKILFTDIKHVETEISQSAIRNISIKMTCHETIYTRRVLRNHPFQRSRYARADA